MQNKAAKQARRKYKDYMLLAPLYKKKDSPAHKAYSRAFYCANIKRVTEDGKVSGTYCHYRCCTICNTMRSQIRYDKYKQYLDGTMQFTTLTIPNCTEQEYPGKLRKMQTTFAQCRETLKLRGTPVIGLSNIEITINVDTKTYHLHMHILHKIVPTFITGHGLKPYLPKEEDTTERVSFWKVGARQNIYYGNAITKHHLKHFPDALPYLQNVKIVIGNDQLREVLKYSVKPPKTATKADHKIYVDMYDKLFIMNKGKQLFNAYNISIPQQTEIEENKEMATISTMETEATPGVYPWHVHDWLHEETGETLSGYIPSKKDQQRHDLLDIKKPPG